MGRPAKPLISRSAAVQAAIEIIDVEGLEAFNVPRLAMHLGVSTSSLYHHFRNKSEILFGVLRYVAGTTIAPTGLPPGPNWPDHFVALALNFRHSLLRYHHVAPLLLRYPPRDLLLDGYEDAVKYLTASGVPTALHIRIVDGMETLTVGTVLGEAIGSLAAAVLACSLGPEEMLEKKVRSFLRGVVVTHDQLAVSNQPRSSSTR